MALVARLTQSDRELLTGSGGKPAQSRVLQAYSDQIVFASNSTAVRILRHLAEVMRHFTLLTVLTRSDIHARHRRLEESRVQKNACRSETVADRQPCAAMHSFHRLSPVTLGTAASTGREKSATGCLTALPRLRGHEWWALR